MDPRDTTIGERVMLMRRRRGLSQRDLAATVAWQSERGRRGSGGHFHWHMPSFRRFQRAKVSRDITRVGPRRSSDLHERARLWRTSAPAGHNLKKQSA